ncbi:hypothetical protein FA95DRAFT_1561739 [Auriscalpium vulgare]|uniref:Uncharacterized protein n=1 Tax=Auriscalpium vulgare TaxID=40419 RepID=A0ACB8RLB1_9AGAM|nr:hypothetical protein FA95DRAFT_1561739 [Auriscalpium vulgare]
MKRYLPSLTSLYPRPFSKTPTRLLAVLILAGSLATCLFLAAALNEDVFLPSIRLQASHTGTIAIANANAPTVFDAVGSGLLAVPRIYVVSLPRRTDRRAQMEQLRSTLGMRWEYVDALDGPAQDVITLMQQVHVLRTALRNSTSVGDASHFRQPPQDPALRMGIPAADDAHAPCNVPTLRWPRDLEDPLRSQGPLPPLGADLWLMPHARGSSEHFVPSEGALEISNSSTLSGGSDSRVAAALPELACASKDSVLADFSPMLPPYKRLTPAKVACWHSHLQAIRAIANGDDSAALVLEDDVDMERDIDERLGGLWEALPKNWDIVYLGETIPSCLHGTPLNASLGHCWSDESKHPALAGVSPPFSGYSLLAPAWLTGRNLSSLHPSTSPKCTHAYVLSREGARRLLVHLRYPPFAYSRAIDQAFAWLVESGRLRAFSVVPAVVVQRKVARSDVMPGRGSAWVGGLYDGVFGSAMDVEGPEENFDGGTYPS